MGISLLADSVSTTLLVTVSYSAFSESAVAPTMVTEDSCTSADVGCLSGIFLYVFVSFERIFSEITNSLLLSTVPSCDKDCIIPFISLQS